MSKGFKVILSLLLASLVLAGCGSESPLTTATPISNQFAGPPTPIPTYTPEPATAMPIPTITPTPIVVLPTPTPPPTATPAPTATPVPPPTYTPFPTQAPRPTVAIPTVISQGPYRKITQEQARNLDGYRALLPTYLPDGYKLTRITYSDIPGSNIISLIVQFETDKTETFYLNIQYIPASAPIPTATVNPSLTPNTPQPTPTLPPVRLRPYPTAGVGIFRQDTVRVRNQVGLLSYSSQFTSLSWTETTSSYALNGLITPDEALKVAESLR